MNIIKQIISMNHEERIEVARTIAKSVIKKYGKNILFIGIYGSVRRNEDREFSDIEMFAVTKYRKKYPYIFFVHKGIAVYLEFLSKGEIFKSIKNVNVSWPAEVGRFLDPLKIYGPEKVIKEFKQTVSLIKEEKFRKAMCYAFGGMVEGFNRVKNDYKDKNPVLLREAVDWFSWYVNMITALINKKYYFRNGINRWLEASQFKIKPRNYESLIKKLYEGKTIDEIFEAAQKLFDECEKLLLEKKIKIKEISNISQIKI